MKIDYTNYPILKMIEDGTMNFKMLSSHDEKGFTLCMNLLAKIWPSVISKLQKNVCYPCKTYLDAINKSAACFDKLIDSAIGNHPQVSASEWTDTQEPKPLTEEDMIAEEKLYDIYGNAYGCYLFGTGQVLIYGIGKEPCKHDFCIEIIRNTVIRAFVQYDEDYAYFVSNDDVVSSVFSKISRYAIGVISQMHHEAHMLTMFERYAKIETRYLCPKTNMRIDLKSFDRTRNETKLRVHVRDSRYFTNIIRNEGFMVNGHLRLQPKKVNGEWTRELIYIDSFMKHGYHRNATIAK